MRFLIVTLGIVYIGLYYALNIFAETTHVFENMFLYIGVVFFVSSICLFLTLKRYKRKIKKEKKKLKDQLGVIVTRHKKSIALGMVSLGIALGVFSVSSMSYFYLSLFFILPIVFLFPHIFAKLTLQRESMFIGMVFFLLLCIGVFSLYHLWLGKISIFAPIALCYSAGYFFLYALYAKKIMAHCFGFLLLGISVFEMYSLEMAIFYYSLIFYYFLLIQKLALVMYDIDSKKFLYLALAGFVLCFGLLFYNFPSNFSHVMLFIFLQIMGLGYTFCNLTQINIYASIQRKFFRSPGR